MITKKQTGFTLIELMVAITIVAILATIGLITYSTAQKTARVSKRVDDLKAITAAVELYKVATGSYPVVTLGTSTGWRSECAAWGSHASKDVIPGLVPSYMPQFPSDPSMNTVTNRSCYLYISDGYNYKILVHNVEEMSANNGADYKIRPALIDPLRDNGPQVISPETACDGIGDGSIIISWATYTNAWRCY